MIQSHCNRWWIHGAGRERDGLRERLGRLRSATGIVFSAFETWLSQHALLTLPLRLQAASRNALCIAERLGVHGFIEPFVCPGLPIQALARRGKKAGIGDLLAMRVKGWVAAAWHVVAHKHSFLPAASFGRVERLIEHHESIEASGSLVPDALLRLSAGIEDVGELNADLDLAVAGARG